MIAKEQKSVEKLVWNVRETAQHLGVSERTVWRLKAEEQLPYTMIGGRVKFIPQDIRQYCLDRRQVTETAST